MTEDRDAIALAERVLAILDEGRFSTTYKFALFTAFLDLCMEKTSTKGVSPSVLTTHELARKVVESYWDHSLPYGQHGVLRQGGNKGGQAEILRRICKTRELRADARSDTIFRAQQQDPIGFESLVRFVEWKLIEMPIPRLQVLGKNEDRFLYQYNWTQSVSRAEVVSYQRGGASDFDNRLLLLPGVAENLVRLAGLLRPLFRRHWAMMVASSNDLHEAELEEFLFGAERIPLDAVRAPLLDLQDRFCFYCDHRIVGRADVDHFIPWARFRDDDHRRNAKLAHSSAGLGDELLFHKRGLVRSREQLLAQSWPVFAQVNWQFIHRHPVHAGTALVPSHSLQCGQKVRAFAHLLHQAARSRAFVFMRRRRRFLASVSRRGFTPSRNR